MAQNLFKCSHHVNSGCGGKFKGQTSARCGFRGKVGTIPKSSRAAFRNELGHDSGMKPGADSDFKPVTF
ncbi:MAG: hypothetical protein WB763_26205, partial [Terriglobia bacterium]